MLNALLTHSGMGGGQAAMAWTVKWTRAKEYVRGQRLNWFQAENETEIQLVLTALLA